MSYLEEHVFADIEFEIPLTDIDGEFHQLIVDISGTFNIRFPGKLFLLRDARHLTVFDPVEVPEVPELPEGVGGGGGSGRLGGAGSHGQPPGGGRPTITSTPVPLTVDVRTPDGMPFTKDEVTLADLAKFRDVRGESKGHWTYRLFGRSSKYLSAPNSPVKAFPGSGYFKIILQERVPSKSAPPLVYAEIPAGGKERYNFDLFRVGTYVATASPPRMLKLIDPNGTTVATSDTGELRFPVSLQTIDLSRDANGKVRTWALDAREESPALDAPTAVFATVVETARIRTEQVTQRLQTLLGDGGGKIELFGRDMGEKVQLCIKINDEITAGTLDMHHLLEDYIPSDVNGQRHVEVGRAYVLGETERFIVKDFSDISPTLDFAVTFKLSIGTVRIGRIDIAFGPSEHSHQPSPLAPPIGPPVPCLKLNIAFSGEGSIETGGVKVATLTVSTIPIEVGLRQNADGTLLQEIWTAGNPLDVDISVGAAVAAGVLSPLVLGAAIALIESKESSYNDKIVEGITDFFTSVLKRAPRFLAVLLGDAFSFTSFRPEGDEFVLDYVAPVEPEPKPSKMYKAIIGRSVTEVGPHAQIIKPRTLGNTWEAGNLKEKIDHIFIVMMENRSFDHVLGYLAAAPNPENSDGLSADIVQAMQAFGPVRPLRQTAIGENEVHLRTKLDEHVGHGLRDVREQIAHTINADGRAILSPQGFIANFVKHRASDSEIEPADIMGYYTNDPRDSSNPDDQRDFDKPDKDLPFFDFLVKNYAWCERFFCSHPGPTLPNRMLWLTGDVQYDRTGEAILDNNKGDNFFLSRTHNICDLLTRKGISWRVYESPPSVAMLRMFARYSTDSTNIVPFSRERLTDDVMNEDVPSVVFIEPAMHHFPPNDDHPPADMYNGQLFLKDVYDAITAKDEVWGRSMLIITYDEHGGFYDHVIPPVAEIRTAPFVRGLPEHVLEPVREEGGSGGSGSGGGAGGGPGGRGGFGIVRELAEAVLAGEGELPESVIVGPLGDTRAPISEVFEGEPGLTPTPIEGHLSVTTHYGVRVPTFVVSPWVERGKGPDIVLDHCSILKTILACFLGDEKPFLSDRVHSSRSFDAYLNADAPRMGIASPDLEPLEEHMHRPADPIITKAVFRRQMQRGNVDYHDLTGMMARIIGPPRR